jgi:hypothetical protein
MTIYSLVLFVHVTAVLILAAVLTVETLSLYYLRRATSAIEARPWIDPVPGLRSLAIGSLAVILISAIYLVIPIATFHTAWPKVAVLSLLLMGPLGAMTGRRMRAIRQAASHQKMIGTELLDQLRDRFLKMSLCVRIAVFFGIFLLVSIKPGLWASVGLMGASVVVGLLSYRLSTAPEQRAAREQSNESPQQAAS